ncbi:hypothetical protein [Sphingobacterium siyangense]|uniref:hypothetical protein n=1 Tax=Sphingobacterium siyangense TaxID=459529 RepID=UPI003017C816
MLQSRGFLACIFIVTPFGLIAHTVSQDTMKSFGIDEFEISSKYYKRYNPRQLSEALWLEASLLNLPQQIQVVNSEIFRDQVVLNLNESATRNSSGTFREALHNGYISRYLFSWRLYQRSA